MTWRVMVEHSHVFARDELNLFMICRDSNGTRTVEPVQFRLGDYLSETTTEMPEPSTIPRELAEALFEALGAVLIGSGEPLKEIQRLTRELRQTQSRLDKLIDGIGRLGGNTS